MMIRYNYISTPNSTFFVTSTFNTFLFVSPEVIKFYKPLGCLCFSAYGSAQRIPDKPTRLNFNGVNVSCCERRTTLAELFGVFARWTSSFFDDHHSTSVLRFCTNLNLWLVVEMYYAVQLEDVYVLSTDLNSFSCSLIQWLFSRIISLHQQANSLIKMIDLQL